jgi:hypothetical protein
VIIPKFAAPAEVVLRFDLQVSGVRDLSWDRDIGLAYSVAVIPSAANSAVPASEAPLGQRCLVACGLAAILWWSRLSHPGHASGRRMIVRLCRRCPPPRPPGRRTLPRAYTPASRGRCLPTRGDLRRYLVRSASSRTMAIPRMRHDAKAVGGYFHPRCDATAVFFTCEVPFRKDH